MRVRVIMWEYPAGLFCGGSGGALGLGKVGKKIKIWLCAGAQGPPHPPGICMQSRPQFYIIGVTHTGIKQRCRGILPRDLDKKIPRRVLPTGWRGDMWCISRQDLVPLYSPDTNLSRKKHPIAHFIVFLLTYMYVDGILVLWG